MGHLDIFKAEFNKLCDLQADVFIFEDTTLERIKKYSNVPCFLISKNTSVVNDERLPQSGLRVSFCCSDDYSIPINSEIVVNGKVYTASSEPRFYKGTHQEILLKGDSYA